jgi:hypothetical protein
MRTAVGMAEPDETEFVRFLKARVADEQAAAAGKVAFVDAVTGVPMWPSKEAAEAIRRALQGLAVAYASHPDFREEWRA